MHFLVDAQLPPVLCSWLREQGHDADHVADFGMAGADDRDIWMKALERADALLTKDEDFVSIRGRASHGTAVCWLRVGNVTNPELFVWMERVFPAMVAALVAGEAVIEVR